MKKLKLFLTSIVAMFVATVGVHALTAGNGGLDQDLLKVEATPGEEYGTVKVTVKVNQETIDQILAQHPGYQDSPNGEASLGVFYISIDPGITKDGNALDEHYAYTSADCDFSCAMAKAKANADNQYEKTEAGTPKYAHDDQTTIWTLGVQVLYNKDGVWTEIDAIGDGTRTIKEELKHLTSKSNLKYGEDFIFAVPESDTAWVWRLNAEPVEYTYVRVTYDIEFPITASNGERSYYYADMKQALEEAEKTGATDITVYDDTDVTEEVTVPAGVTIKTADGATLTFEKTVTIEAGANITGENVTYKADVTKYYAVTTEAENGKVTVDKSSAKKDDVVTITIKANEGYELDKLYVDGKEQTELTFKMPEKDVVVKATFKKVAFAVEENPKTGDNILMYLGLGLASVAVATLSVKKLKKSN